MYVNTESFMYLTSLKESIESILLDQVWYRGCGATMGHDARSSQR